MIGFKETICKVNAEIEGVFGANKVKTHDSVQAYNDINSEYYAEIGEAEDLVFYDDEYDVFVFFIVRAINYQDMNSTNRIKEVVNGELVCISKSTLIEQLVGVSTSTVMSRDVYILNEVFLNLMVKNNLIPRVSTLDTAINERRYMKKNTLSVEHRIISIAFTFESIVKLCLDLDCIYNPCND